MLEFIQSLNHETLLYIAFGIIVVIAMVVDLGVFNRTAHRVSFKSAGIQVSIWVTIALLFGLAVYYYDDHEAAFQYYTAYVTEYALSVDNIFVFIMVFRFFKVDEKYHHKVLYYGVIGAVFFRAVFIFATAAIIGQMEWILYIFGAILLYTGGKMLFSGDDDGFNPEESGIYKFLSKRFRFAPDDGQGSLVRYIDGKRYFTTLFMVILLIEGSDIIFAVDSIPAAFGITKNQFVIYTSNIFAIMGLRSLYFLLEGLAGKFHLLEKGVSFVLIFIGLKMMVKMGELFGWGEIHIPEWISLSVIVFILAGSIIASIIFPKSEEEEAAEAASHAIEAAEEAIAMEDAPELEIADDLRTESEEPQK